MALFMLCGNDSSPSTRIYILALIALVFVCSFSYCSSFGSPAVDISNNIDNFDFNNDFDDENNLSLRSSPYYLDAAEHPRSSKNLFLNLLLKSALAQTGNRHHRQYQIHVNSRRYVPQSFHAMRG